MPKAHLTQTDLVTGFRDLGVQAGDLVFVHASLSRFGNVEGGARSVIDAFAELLGPRGTLAMPGFTFDLKDLPQPVFDVRHTPCWVGKIYELFRTEYATHRSHHVTHSVCARGPRAGALTGDHGASPFGATSPFRKLAAWGGKILMLGVSHNCNTTFHAVEEQEQLFYFGLRDNPNVAIIDEQGVQRPLPTLLHASTRRYDFNRMNEGLLRGGIQREQFIGDSLVRRLDAHAMFEYAAQAVRHDSEALLCRHDRRVQIPIGRVDGRTMLG